MTHEKINSEKTIAVLAIFFILLFLIVKNIVFIYITFIILFAGMFVKPVGELIAKFWLKISIVMGTLNSKIILLLVFYLILTPLATIRRRIFKDNLLWLSKPNNRSYWKDKNRTIQKEDMEKLW